MEATSQLLSDLTSGLAAAGLSVAVITASTTEHFSQERLHGVTVHRDAATTIRSHRTMIGRIRGYLGFLQHVRRNLRHLVAPGDLVVFMTDPPLLGPLLGNTARRQGAAVWHWTQDLYPEVAIALLAPKWSRSVFQPLLRWRNREWNRSRGIVTIGADMQRLVQAQGIDPSKTWVHPNWFPSPPPRTRPSVASSRAEPKPFVIAYSGNFGRAHDIDAIATLALRIGHAAGVEFSFTGLGAGIDTLKRAFATDGMPPAHFRAPVPHSELLDALAAADLHLVTMHPDCAGVVWPSKFYGIVAANRPMIFIGPAEAEIAAIIDRERLGVAVTPADLAPAIALIQNLAGNLAENEAHRQRVAMFAGSQPGLPGAVAAWQALLSDPISPSPSDPAPVR